MSYKTIIPIALFLFFLSSNIYASGVGFYSSFNYGTSKSSYATNGFWDIIYSIRDDEDEEKKYPIVEHQTRQLRGIFGLILDLDNIYHNLFQFRYSIGYGKGIIKSKTKITDEFSNPVTVNREFITRSLEMFASFGPGHTFNETIRLWFGPQIGMRYSRSRCSEEYAGLKNRFGDMNLYIGIVTGMNINLNNNLILFFDLGFRTFTPIMFEKKTIIGTGNEGFLNSGILFKI